MPLVMFHFSVRVFFGHFGTPKNGFFETLRFFYVLDSDHCSSESMLGTEKVV